MQVRLYLTESRWLRFGGFFSFYFAQGIPIGLISLALPAWLAAQGISAAEIATMAGITGLPWGFKLIAGPFMDRFSFPAMGRRRPWVMGAQAGLTLSMLAMCTVNDPAANLWHIIAIGFVINCFGALQDVATDGMAIDVLPEDERGRANAFMACGQVTGYSVFGALNGFLLANYGLPVTALVSTAAVGIIFLLITLIRERTGEKLLPWTEGRPALNTGQLEPSFRAIFKDLMRAVFLPMGLLMLAVEFFIRAPAGIGMAIVPVIATQELGFGSDQYAYLAGILGGISAVLGLFFGPVIDRFGAARLLMIALLGQAALMATFATLRAYWGNTEMVIAFMAVSDLLGQLVFVAMIAAFMNICWRRVAATQFAIYMSLSNLSRSIGAGLFALIAADVSYTQAIYIMSISFVIAAGLLAVFDEHKARSRLEALDVVNS
jgi:PAT family beta-lactamase induction signal transducer AmpG